MFTQKERTHRLTRWIGPTLLATSLLIGPASQARAEERKFLVSLATSPKHYFGYPGNQPVGGLVNAELINKQYFDVVNPNILSHAEYWEEISYGDVTLAGKTTDWVQLPWSIQPPRITGGVFDPDGENAGDIVRISPKQFIDLDNDNNYAFGTAEAFDTAVAAVIVDITGDPNGSDNGPFFPNMNPGFAQGSGALDRTNGIRDVYAPSERFVDVDGDGRWDGLDEARNVMDWNGDGFPDFAGPWIDLNGDNQANPGLRPGADCIYLNDADNDFFPDCCPGGPGTPGCDPFPDPNACLPTKWNLPNDGGEFIDCNGNMINDADDIDSGLSRDVLPFVESEDSTSCVEGEGDGIPDECQVENAGVNCAIPTNCLDPENPSPCCVLATCELLPTGPNVDPAISRVPQTRCEYIDSDNNGSMNIVEPFENFLRRWDPCLYDNAVSGPNAETDATHWVKVYDPLSTDSSACSSPMYSATYNDPSYIINNFAGDPQLMIDRAGVRPVFAQHDPNGIGGDCVCAIPFDFDGDTIPEPTCGTVNGQPGMCFVGFHADYNPGDSFTNVTQEGPGGVTIFTSKMQARGGGGGFPDFVATTPEPGTYPDGAPVDEAWYQQFWDDHYSPGTCLDAGGAEVDCLPPEWPMGFDPNLPPVPGGPQGGAPTPNTLFMTPYIAPDETRYVPETHRRFFKANFGGTNGNGTGWVGEPPVANMAWETGPLDQFGFEADMNRPILPEEVGGASTPPEFFDGWVEFEDLPSSKYHQGGDHWLGEITSPWRTWAADNKSAVNGYDPQFGNEIRRVPQIWGHDRGTNVVGSPSLAGDQLTIAAGPYAIRGTGNGNGIDSGNQLLLELLTWRTAPPFNNGFIYETNYGTGHPYAGPGPAGDMMPNANLGFRDYNLDGLVDQGEVRPAGSDNYTTDPYPGSTEPGTGTQYPWNRRRMIEDIVMILDPQVDFDDFVDPVAMARLTCPSNFPFPILVPMWLGGAAPTEDVPGDFIFAQGVISGIILLPDDAHAGDEFPRATSFQSDFGNPNVIHNEDNNDVENKLPQDPAKLVKFNWNVVFHELPKGLDSPGENNQPVEGVGLFQTPYAAHEYLHSWEGFPDLYDYEVFSEEGNLINCPIGAWCIMAGGGLVHPVPVLKEAPCTEWIEPIDLTTVLTPGVDKLITLPAAEFVRDDSHYFLENPLLPGERHYFWSSGSGFDIFHPGNGGVLMLHTDVGANPEALPQQQTNGNKFTYKIIQADGLNELDAGTECGDAGDLWPGSTSNTTFGFGTDPKAAWWTLNAFTGLEVLDIQLDGNGGAQMVFNWTPTDVPSIKFIDPPGGVNVGDIYQVRTRPTDTFGGTLVQLFYTKNPTDVAVNLSGGNFIGSKAKVSPGTIQMTQDWNIGNVADSQYNLFARLVPGTNADGQLEKSFSTPRAGRNNKGNGVFQVNSVDAPVLRTKGTIGVVTNGTGFAAFTGAGQPINLVAAGVKVGDTFTAFVAGFNPILRTVQSIAGNQLTFNTTTGVPNNSLTSFWDITSSNNKSRIEAWTVKCIKADGSEWTVHSSITQPEPKDTDVNQDPFLHAFTCTIADQQVDPTCASKVYTSKNGEVKFVIREQVSPPLPGDLPGVVLPFTLDDTFTFVTTGISAPSAQLTLINNEIKENPTAVIKATPLSGKAPLLVTLDGRDSFDPNGETLTYQWTFGDGTPGANADLVQHTFTQSKTFTVLLKVTNSKGLFGEAAVDIVVNNNSPNASLVAIPESGPAPLTVAFDASQSSDGETATANLIFQWDFGDGETANQEGAPGTAFATVNHFYSDEGEYIAVLTVTDEGGKTDVATKKIVVGNTNPVPSIFHTSITGTAPLKVDFNASTSFDADGDPLTVTWNWGDGTPSETWPAKTGNPASGGGGKVSHTYNLPAGQTSASFNTTAIVKDDTNGQATWQGVSVSISQAGPGASTPQAVFKLTPVAPKINVAFTADATASFDRPIGDPLASYTWNFGDGSAAKTVTTPTTTHTYTKSGTFEISLTVADTETPPNTHTSKQTVVISSVGGVDPDDPENPIETNMPPIAILVVNPPQGVAGVTQFQFDGSNSSDPDGEEQTEALEFIWEFGDGTVAEGATVVKVYDTAGVYQARLTVRDEFNGTNTKIQTIEVVDPSVNAPPVAIIATGPKSGTAPATLQFNGQTSYDPNNDSIELSWRVEQNGQLLAELTGAVVQYTFTVPGSYTIALDVTDSFGQTDTAGPVIILISQKLNVVPVDPDPDQDLDDDDDNGSSGDQRPTRLCGLGMVMGFFGSLAGLSVMMAGRRMRRKF